VNDADDKIYSFGGSVSYWNTSFPGYKVPYNHAFSLFSYDVGEDQFERYVQGNLSTNPSNCASANIPELGLGFCFNGRIDDGSSLESQNYGPNRTVFLTGMVIVDLNEQASWNLSTAAISPTDGRSGAGLQYVPSIGEKGALVLIGGGTKAKSIYSNDTFGDLVSVKGSLAKGDFNRFPFRLP
jgi:hypothetical protein